MLLNFNNSTIDLFLETKSLKVIKNDQKTKKYLDSIKVKLHDVSSF